jgi:hypothetical protein
LDGTQIDALERLQRLRDSGSLSNEEFQEAKTRILAGRYPQRETGEVPITLNPIRYETKGSEGGGAGWAAGIIFALILGALALGLSVSNPTESDLKAFLTNAARNELGKNIASQDLLSQLGNGIANAIMPNIIDSALIIDRDNYFIFSIYRIKPSPIAKVLLPVSFDEACLIGIGSEFYKCPE